MIVVPYTRCTACGGAVRPVPKADIVDLLEPGTRRTRRDFARCQSCGSLYWHGAHAARLDRSSTDMPDAPKLNAARTFEYSWRRQELPK